MLTDEPAWLVRWRRGEPPLQPPPQPQAGVAQGGSRAKRKARPTRDPSEPRPNSFGFTEPLPEAWAWDGGHSREAVLDHDFYPPLKVREVGWNRCMCCAKPFWSENVIAVRLCNGCKEPHDRRAGVARGGAG